MVVYGRDKRKPKAEPLVPHQHTHGSAPQRRWDHI